MADIKKSYECLFSSGSERLIERELQTRLYIRNKDQDITTYETFSRTLPETRIKISLDHSSKKARIDIIYKNENITKKDIEEKILKKELKNILQ